ncbi:hypothetical protein NKR23_g4682 [Pleurostoma richardsiae]|uniref:CMP/dCMP-type deaminase domain-containing protein n=1 Tax=Pleurostoma richardsiae TaxID=41990 RepID=A0AA38VV25_9PEZI|nr:hypothetical protein NKR23_g4682 [Pleurostoma richardsiae]
MVRLHVVECLSFFFLLALGLPVAQATSSHNHLDVSRLLLLNPSNLQFNHENGNAGQRSRIPLSTREHWMRRANAALAELSSPCPFAAFATVIVNHTDTDSLGEAVCVGVNSGSSLGNPTLHGEIATIDRCSETLQSPPYSLTPAETLRAFRDFTLYTNGEPCPMCASAIRWAGFRECVFGTSIETLIRLGWNQIDVRSSEIFSRSSRLPTETTLISDVLAAETDPFFSWQFDSDFPCPEGCIRGESGRCVPV